MLRAGPVTESGNRDDRDRRGKRFVRAIFRGALDVYLVLLWALSGEAMYVLFSSWRPQTHHFWDSTWAGGLLIGVFAAIIVAPAAYALKKYAKEGSKKTEN
jgi:hypothetical protein